jgi:hypothetical protein
MLYLVHKLDDGASLEFRTGVAEFLKRNEPGVWIA